MRRVLVTTLMLLMLIALAPRLMAAEPGELREKARAIKREAVELKERGRAQAAEELARKAAELAEAAERMEERRPQDLEQHVEKLHQKLKELLDKERRMQEARAPGRDLDEIRERIARTERELDEVAAAHRRRAEERKGAEPRPEMMAKAEEAVRRAKHFRIAAENLQAVAAEDLAHQFFEKAEDAEREAREIKRRMMDEGKRRGGPELEAIPSQVEALRHEVVRLRGEMNELRQHVKELERGLKQRRDR